MAQYVANVTVNVRADVATRALLQIVALADRDQAPRELTSQERLARILIAACEALATAQTTPDPPPPAP